MKLIEIIGGAFIYTCAIVMVLLIGTLWLYAIAYLIQQSLWWLLGMVLFVALWAVVALILWKVDYA